MAVAAAAAEVVEWEVTKILARVQEVEEVSLGWSGLRTAIDPARSLMQ